MFHFARDIVFGVDVGDLLQLQCAFERQKDRRGRVVNLIGNDGVKPSYWEIAPAAANAAGQNLTLALAAQYGKDNIRFVAINPDPVRTERWTGLVDATARDMNRARGG